MKMKYIALALALLLALLPGCQNTGTGESSPGEESGGEAPEGGILPGVGAENYPRVDGSTANVPMMARLYSEICGVTLEEAEEKVTFSGGTGLVWRGMMYDQSDLLLVYEAPETVKQEIEEMNLELDIQPFARDGLVFLVNKNNPVDSLTKKQLVDIYTGKITNWQEVGGNDGPITAYQRNEESGSQTLFKKLLMEGTEPMKAPSEWIPGSMGGLIDAVAAYDGAGGSIGYSVYYYANLMYENPDLKLLKIDGVEPASETIRDGSYPFVNDVYGVVRQGDEGAAKLLRDWLLTDDAKGIIEESGYVALQ